MKYEIGDYVMTPEGAGEIIAIDRYNEAPYYVSLDDRDGEAEYFYADELTLL
jgi:hypothetical protein